MSESPKFMGEKEKKEKTREGEEDPVVRVILVANPKFLVILGNSQSQVSNVLGSYDAKPSISDLTTCFLTQTGKRV